MTTTRRGTSAKQAELPLSGGRPGARVRLHPLTFGSVAVPPGYWHRESRGALRKALGLGVPRSEWLTIPVVAFLVEHPSAGPFMVDTGLAASVLDAPRKSLRGVAGFMFWKTAMRPEQVVREQLAVRGYRPEDVGLVVMTHLHADHTSGMADLPNARFLVSREEWDAANGGVRARIEFVARHWCDREVHLVDFGRGAPLEWFDAALDLFGDGSVRLLSTPGHTRGHLSVLVETEAGELLIVGDAAFTERTLATGERPFVLADVAAYERSLRALQAYAREHPETLLIPGHDMAAWQRLASTY